MPKKARLSNLFSKANRIYFKRFFNGLFFLGLFIVIILVFFTFYLFKSWYSETMAKYLPAQQTVALLEVDLDGNSPAVQNFWKFFGQSKLINPLQLGIYAQYLLPNFQTYQPLLQSRAGTAVLEINNQLVPVFFFRLKPGQNLSEALKAFQTPDSQQSLETTLNGQTLLSFDGGNNTKVLKVGDNLFVSDNLPALQSIADVVNGKSAALSSSPVYNQTASSLTDQNLIFGYLDHRVLNQDLLQNQNYLDQNIKLLARYLPLLKIYQATAFSIRPEENQITFRSVTTVDPALTNNAPLLSFPESYRGQLADLLGKNHTVLLGGHNLKYEYDRLSEIYQGRPATDDAISQTIYQGEFQSLFNLILPDSVDLYNEVLPLFQNEYAFAYDYSANPSFTFISKLSDPADYLKWQTLEQKLKPKFAAFFPVQTAVTLPDGTTGKTLVAQPDSVQISDQNINGITAQVISNGDPAAPKLFSAFQNGLLIISNDQNGFSDLLSRSQKLSDLQNTNYLHGADEIFLLQFAPVIQAFHFPDYIGSDFLNNLKLYYSKKYQQGNIIDQIILNTD